ncbi:MAG: glyoxalase/bleomycin resistance/dioxygenase family protein [Planctomycetia bacterium]|nr:glyoxalase/bleomycin resistance/dioxygenase family protein [Planctomycetia bacterium]
MVKFHASLNVSNLSRAVAFYQALFGVGPAKAYADYAKFEIDEPPLILSLKPQRCGVGGPLNHLGVRVKTLADLQTIQMRLEKGGFSPKRQDDVKCCYAYQTKFWVTDPDGTLWEIYVLFDDHPTWGEGNKLALMMPPIRAMGFMGSIRRWLSRFRTTSDRKPDSNS